MSSSVPTIIDFIIENEAHGRPIVHKPSVLLYVASTDPLVFEDSAKNQLAVNKTNLETFLTSYNKSLPNCDITLKLLPLTPKATSLLKSRTEIRLSLTPVDGLILPDDSSEA